MTFSFALGGNAFYTFTIGEAPGFPTKCAMRIYNSDSGRGKGIYIIGLTRLLDCDEFRLRSRRRLAPAVQSHNTHTKRARNIAL